LEEIKPLIPTGFNAKSGWDLGDFLKKYPKAHIKLYQEHELLLDVAGKDYIPFDGQVEDQLNPTGTVYHYEINLNDGTKGKIKDTLLQYK